MHFISVTSSRTKHTIIKILQVTSCVSLILCSSISVTAQEPEQEDSQWGIGIGAASIQKPYKDIDRNNMVIPVLSHENKYIRLFGPSIDVKLPGFDISDSQQLDFSLTATYDFGGYDKDDIRDTPILNGMDKRKGGFWAGTKAKWQNDLVNIKTEWLADVSGNSKGQRASLEFEKTWHVGHHIMLSPRVATHWSDKKYVDYHYGVRPYEARNDRPVYTGDSAFNVEYGVRGIYMFDMKHSVFLDVSATTLANEIKDSPLVDRSTENKILFAYMYRF